MATKSSRSPKLKLGERAQFWTSILTTIATFLAVFIAFRALMLQERQANEYREQDRIRSIQDSIKNERFIELSQQQIEALKQQTEVSKENVRQENAYQKPNLSIELFGFHVIDKNGGGPLVFRIKNDGFRPAILKKVTRLIFNSNFKYEEGESIQTNTLLVKDNVFEGSNVNYNEKTGSYFWSKEEISKFKTHFICFLLEYEDTINKKPSIEKSAPIFFKWEHNPGDKLFPMQSGETVYYNFISCSILEAENIKKAMKKPEVIKIINQ